MPVQTILLVIVLTYINSRITSHWAQFGLIEGGLPLPQNFRMIKLVVSGMALVTLANILDQKGIPVLKGNETFVLVTILGLPTAFFMFMRWVMPKGLLEYNKAHLRTLLWSGKYYQPGCRNVDGNEFAKFDRAIDTLTLFGLAISRQSQGTTFINRENVAIAYDNLGWLYRMMNRYQDAKEAYQKGLKVVEQLLKEGCRPQVHQSLQSLLYYRIGELCHVQGNYSEARQWYQRSHDIDTWLGDKQGARFTADLMAKLA